MEAGVDVSAAPSPAPRFAVRTTTRLSSVGVIAAVGLVAALVVLPAFADRRLIQDLFFVLTMLVLAQSWNLLAGYAGLLSVGQQAFVGLGGYALFALTIMAGFDPALAVVLSGVIAGIVAVPTAFIVFRLQGAYFAIGTWVVAETMRLVLAQVKQLGGGTGTSLPPVVTGAMVGLDAVRRLFDVRGSAARDGRAQHMINKTREAARERKCGRRATVRQKGIEMKKCYHGCQTVRRVARAVNTGRARLQSSRKGRTRSARP